MTRRRNEITRVRCFEDSGGGSATVHRAEPTSDLTEAERWLRLYASGTPVLALPPGSYVHLPGRNEWAALLAEYDRLREQRDAVLALCRDAMKLPTLDDPRPADDRISPRAVRRALGATE